MGLKDYGSKLNKLREERENFLELVHSSEKKVARGEMTRYQRQFTIQSITQGVSEQQYLRNLEADINEYEQTLNADRSKSPEFRNLLRVSLGVLVIIIALIALIIPGLIQIGNQNVREYSVTLNSTYYSGTEFYNWNIPRDSQINSIKINGAYSGDVQVYLVMNDTSAKYLVFDSKKYEENIVSVTGNLFIIKGTPGIQGTALKDICDETCKIEADPKNTHLEIVVGEKGFIRIDNIVYTQVVINHAPTQIKDITYIVLNDSSRSIDLSTYFSDEEGDKLTYTLSNIPGVSIQASGNIVTFNVPPKTRANYSGFLFVSDGREKINSNVFKIIVNTTENYTSSKIQNLSNTAKNITENNTDNIPLVKTNHTLDVNSSISNRTTTDTNIISNRTIDQTVNWYENYSYVYGAGFNFKIDNKLKKIWDKDPSTKQRVIIKYKPTNNQSSQEYVSALHTQLDVQKNTNPEDFDVETLDKKKIDLANKITELTKVQELGFGKNTITGSAIVNYPIDNSMPDENNVSVESLRKELTIVEGKLIVAQTYNELGNLDSISYNPDVQIEVLNTNFNKLGMLRLNDLIDTVYIDEPVETTILESINITRVTDSRLLGVSGNNVSICILDTGINFNFVPNAVNGYNFVDDNANSTDNNGHGTAMGYVIYNIAPGSKTVSVKVMDKNGSGYESAIISGLQYCLEQNVSIISMSLGGGNYSGYCDNNLVAAKVNELTNSGVTVIASTGNDGSSESIRSPACARNAIRVGASTKQDTFATFTDYNNATILLAPGANINSIDLDGNSFTGSGTSFSSPMIAGITALLLEYEKQQNSSNILTPKEIYDRLVHTGQIIDYIPNDSTNLVKEFSRVDAYNLLTNNITNNLTEGSVSTDIIQDTGTYGALVCSVTTGGLCNNAYGTGIGTSCCVNKTDLCMSTGPTTQQCEPAGSCSGGGPACTTTDQSWNNYGTCVLNNCSNATGPISYNKTDSKVYLGCVAGRECSNTTVGGMAIYGPGDGICINNATCNMNYPTAYSTAYGTYYNVCAQGRECDSAANTFGTGQYNRDGWCGGATCCTGILNSGEIGASYNFSGGTAESCSCANGGETCDDNAADGPTARGACASSTCATSGVVCIHSGSYYNAVGSCSNGDDCDSNITSNGYYTQDSHVCSSACVIDGSVANGGSCCGTSALCNQASASSCVSNICKINNGAACTTGTSCNSSLCIQGVCRNSSYAPISPPTSPDTCSNDGNSYLNAASGSWTSMGCLKGTVVSCNFNYTDLTNCIPTGGYSCDTDVAPNYIANGLSVYGPSCDINDVCMINATAYGTMSNCSTNDACDSNVSSGTYIPNGHVFNNSCIVDSSLSNGTTCYDNVNCASSNCRKEINSSNYYCAGAGKLCSQNGGNGYASGNSSGSWICTASDTSVNCTTACATVLSNTYYCNGASAWKAGSGSGINVTGCTTFNCSGQQIKFDGCSGTGTCSVQGFNGALCLGTCDNLCVAGQTSCFDTPQGTDPYSICSAGYTCAGQTIINNDLCGAGPACGNTTSVCSGLCNYCNSGSGTCANNASTNVCRPSTGTCDIAENCTGVGNCPANTYCGAGTYWNGTACTAGNCSGTAHCNNQSTFYTGYTCDAGGNNCNVNYGLTNIPTAGQVCTGAGLSVAPSSATTCGTGAQNCWCSNSYYQCNNINDCTYDSYYVGFTNTGNGACDTTGAVQNTSGVINPVGYRCNISSVTPYASYTSIMDTNACDATANCTGETYYTGHTCSAAGTCTVGNNPQDKDSNSAYCTYSGNGCVARTWYGQAFNSGSNFYCCGDDAGSDSFSSFNASLTTGTVVKCSQCNAGSANGNTTIYGNGYSTANIATANTTTCYYGDVTCSFGVASNGVSTTLCGNGFFSSSNTGCVAGNNATDKTGYCYWNDMTCADNSALNGSVSAILYGNGNWSGTQCYYGDINCTDNSYNNGTNGTTQCTATQGATCCNIQSTIIEGVKCGDGTFNAGTSNDRDTLQYRCQNNTNGCTAYTWFTNLPTVGGQCCGDDAAADNNFYYSANPNTTTSISCERCNAGVYNATATLYGNGYNTGIGSTCYFGAITCNATVGTNGTSCALTSGKVCINRVGCNSTPVVTTPTITWTNNLTVTYTATDAESDPITNFTDWRRNGTSIAVLNMPFNNNVSSLSAGALNDYSTFGNNGTLGGGAQANAPTWTTSGKIGGGYSFNGSQYINITSNSNLAISNNIIIEAWIKSTSGGTVVSRGASDTNENYRMTVNVNQIYIDSSNGTDKNEYFTATNILDGNWHHIVGKIVAGTAFYTYMDGIALSNASAPTVPPSPLWIGSADLTIGSLMWASAYFNGTIDEVKIFNRSLSPEQIQQEYLAGLAGKSTDIIVSNETLVGENWSVLVGSCDQFSCGTNISANVTTITWGTLTFTFVSPTPANASRTIANSVSINASVTTSAGTIDTCKIEYNGVNYSMTKNATGPIVNCNWTNATVDGTLYTYKIYANNSNGVWSNGSTQTFRENTKPTITAVNIIPVNPNSTTNLTCNVSGWSDPEDATGNYYYQWFNGSTLKYTYGPNTATTNNLSYQNLTLGDTWNCTVTPWDGYENGTNKSDNETITGPPTILFQGQTPANDARLIANIVTINVSAALANGTINTCKIQYNNTNYSMTKVGSGANVTCNWTNATIDGGKYAYIVYANNSVGIWGNSALRNFTENTKPTITAVNITPIGPGPSNNLTCTVSGWSDPEDATGNYYYQWFNGSTLKYTYGPNTATTNNLSYQNLTLGDTWNCTVTPWDGYENGTNKSDNETVVAICGLTLAANTTYTLTQNVSIAGNNCFNITTFNVTINCNGYSIIGDNTVNTYGIYSSNNKTIIQNCNILNFGSDIYFNNTNKGVINNTNTTATGSNTAIWLNLGYNNTLLNVNATTSGLFTLVVFDGGNNSIAQSRIYSDSGVALYIAQSNDNNITQNNITTNSGTTIQLYRGSYRNIVTNNTFNSTSGTLMYIDQNSEYNQIYWNNFAGTSGYYIDINMMPLTNYFNTTVGGVSQGNNYYSISSLRIYDANSDGWGDSGPDYPLSTTIWPAKWNSMSSDGTDYGPATTRINVAPNITSNTLSLIYGKDLSVSYTATDADNDAMYNFTDWRRNGTSMAVLNMPFDYNISNNNTGAIKDYSTFGNNGTLGGGNISRTPVWNVSGKVGGAYVFDGANDYISTSKTGMSNNTGTIEAWIKPQNQNGSIKTIFDMASTGFGGCVLFSDGQTGNAPYFFYGNGTNVMSVVGPTLNNNTWYYIAATYDATGAKLYINGILNNSNSITPIINLSATATAYIGSQIGTQRYFNGTIDEVKIFNRSLSPEQIYQEYLDGSNGKSTNKIISNETIIGDVWSTLVGVCDGLICSTNLSNNVTIIHRPIINNIALTSSSGTNQPTDNFTINFSATDSQGDPLYNFTDWRINSASIAVLNMPFNINTSSTTAGAITDYSTYANNGQLGGGTASYSPTWTNAGKVGGAYVFDGINDYINISDAASLDMSDNLSIEAWIKPYTNNTGYAANPIIKSSSTADANFVLYIFDSNVSIQFWANRSGTWGAISGIYNGATLNNWYHVALSYNSATGGQLYINGVAVGSRTGSGLLTTNNQPITLGGRGSSYFNGTIDEVKIFNRTLSAEQIYQEYLAGLNNQSTNILVSNETRNYNNNMLSTLVGVCDYNVCTTDLSNSLTLIHSPIITNVTLNSGVNLTLNYTATDALGDTMYNFTDWRRNGTSIAVINMPFDNNISSLSTGAVIDYSTYGSNGQLGDGIALSAPTWTTSGKIGGAYVFDGASDYIVGRNMLNLGANATVELWIKSTAYDNVTPIVLGVDSYGGNGLSIEFTGGLITWNTGDGTTNAFPGSTYPNSNWHYIVVTNDYNNNSAKLYIDGILNSTASYRNSNSTPALPGNAVIIGTQLAAHGNWFNGTIDEVKIYNKTLSPQQIYQDYIAGNNNKSTNILVSNETQTGEVWTTLLGVCDNNVCTTNVSNNVTIGSATVICGTTFAANSINNLTTNVSINGLNCFNVTVANVTINCNRYTITGSNTTGAYGIYSTAYNTTIKNCNIQNFSTEVYYNGATYGTIINNTLNSTSGTSLILTASSAFNSIYWNNFTQTSGVYINNSNNTNMFNTTNATGHPQGNIYFNITSQEVYDTDGDGWGDSGTAYPISATTWSSAWTGNGSDFGPYTTRTNSTPVMQNATILPSPAYTNASLIGYCNATNSDARNITYNFKWYLNGVVNSSNTTTNNTQGLLINVSTILNTSLMVGQNWTLECQANNSGTTSSKLNSTTITIIPKTPDIPTLISPTNNNYTLNSRQPLFIWNSTNVSTWYEINITSNHDVLLAGNITNVGATTSNYTAARELYLDVEQGASTYYNWTVRGCNIETCSNWSNIWNFSITTYLVITMINSSVTFPTTGPGTKLNTTANLSWTPFLFQNDGNVYANMTNCTINGSMWSTVGLGTQYMQIMAGNTSELGSFDNTTSMMNWTNVSATNNNVIQMLNYNDSRDSAYLHVLIEVPVSEPAGFKSVNMTFNWIG